MISAQELQRASLERSFREFCEKLKRNSELGWSLRPTRLWARGGAVAPGQTIPDLEGKAFDQNVSGDLLRYVGGSKIDFPELAMEFDKVLAMAENAWKSVAA